MKANELMIGDWVSHHGTPRQVVYIYCRPMQNGTHTANEIGFTHDEDEWINADNAEPIPLTEEILKANGFEEDSVYFRYFNGEGSVCYDKRNKLCHLCGNICVDGVIYFIHELQHALRLCGLNELADNFKIKLNIQKTE